MDDKLVERFISLYNDVKHNRNLMKNLSRAAKAPHLSVTISFPDGWVDLYEHDAKKVLALVSNLVNERHQKLVSELNKFSLAEGSKK